MATYVKQLRCSCGKIVSGASNMEVIRREMDHLRVYHSEQYYDMVWDLTPRQIFQWMLKQISKAPKPTFTY